MKSLKSDTLSGDWRRRTGTKTDAHLYGITATVDNEPLCGKHIPWYATVPVAAGRPCKACLLASIHAAGHKATP